MVAPEAGRDAGKQLLRKQSKCRELRRAGPGILRVLHRRQDRPGVPSVRQRTLTGRIRHIHRARRGAFAVVMDKNLACSTGDRADWPLPSRLESFRLAICQMKRGRSLSEEDERCEKSLPWR